MPAERIPSPRRSSSPRGEGNSASYASPRAGNDRFTTVTTSGATVPTPFSPPRQSPVTRLPLATPLSPAAASSQAILLTGDVSQLPPPPPRPMSPRGAMSPRLVSPTGAPLVEGQPLPHRSMADGGGGGGVSGKAPSGVSPLPPEKVARPAKSPRAAPAVPAKPKLARANPTAPRSPVQKTSTALDVHV